MREFKKSEKHDTVSHFHGSPRPSLLSAISSASRRELDPSLAIFIFNPSRTGYPRIQKSDHLHGTKVPDPGVNHPKAKIEPLGPARQHTKQSKTPQHAEACLPFAADACSMVRKGSGPRQWHVETADKFRFPIIGVGPGGGPDRYTKGRKLIGTKRLCMIGSSYANLTSEDVHDTACLICVRG